MHTCADGVETGSKWAMRDHLARVRKIGTGGKWAALIHIWRNTYVSARTRMCLLCVGKTMQNSTSSDAVAAVLGNKDWAPRTSVPVPNSFPASKRFAQVRSGLNSIRSPFDAPELFSDPCIAGVLFNGPS